jgi:hypothetical protein
MILQSRYRNYLQYLEELGKWWRLVFHFYVVIMIKTKQ